MNTAKVRAALMAVLKQKYPTFDPSKLPESAVSMRDVLGDLLISSDESWNDNVNEAIDQVYTDERNPRVVPWTDIPNRSIFRGGTEVAVWKGDITTLQIDAIVNAANDQGLGCFVPDHRCIDNVIHRGAGPRLCRACHEVMSHRGSPLSAGTPPIVTPAFFLPSNHVVHITGPHIRSGHSPTDAERNLLAQAYWGSLEACVKHGIKSIAFCSVSTGLFGFPKDEASDIALMTVFSWLKENPGQLESVIFDVFSDEEEDTYQEKITCIVEKSWLSSIEKNCAPPVQSIRDETLSVAKQWIEKADSVLICAGAGMSVKEGEMVYVNPEDFAKYYPWFPKWGYKTSYETMGLMGDSRVPETAKWALWTKHMHNMRWAFEPNDGYSTLLDMVKDKDYFVLTSNVDGCFERTGFEKERTYTPQGEWTYYQCMTPCRRDAVFESRPMLDKLLPYISEDGHIPGYMIPKCPHCGGEVFGNVRAGNQFLHGKYEQQNEKIRDWMRNQIESNRTVAVIEIGAGFSTPTVTRFPVEAFARDLGKRGRMIRINSSDPEVPDDLDRAVSLAEGWQILADIQSAAIFKDAGREADVLAHQNEEGMKTNHRHLDFARHMKWNTFLRRLKD